MKFTAQEEYGLRCVLHLARAGDAAGGEYRTVGSIAEHEGLSSQYAGRLFRILAKAGIVEGVRGCKGGYALTRPAAETTVAEVLTALGGKLYEPKTCERYRADREFCVHSPDCSIRSLWSGLQLMLDSVLSRTSLADLISGERTMTQWMERNLSAVEEYVETLRSGSSAAAAPRVQPIGLTRFDAESNATQPSAFGDREGDGARPGGTEGQPSFTTSTASREARNHVDID